MSSTPLKNCCVKSTAEGLALCPACNNLLWPDDPKRVMVLHEINPSRSSSVRLGPTSDRAWLFAMIIACLAVFAVIVLADYLVQRKAAHDALAGLQPMRPTAVPSVSTATPVREAEAKVKAKPSTSPEIDLSAGILDPEPPKQPERDGHDAAPESEKPSPTIPRFDDWAASREGRDRRVGNHSVTVWVNTDSGVYHCPGTRWYGKTKVGRYMSQRSAQTAGYRPAYGSVCG